MESEWYCQFRDRIDGPYTVAELLRMANDGELAPTDKVRRGRDGEWIEARRLPGLTFAGAGRPIEEAVAERPIRAAHDRRELEPRRSRRRDESDEFAEELVADALDRPFDGPWMRLERLLAMTGGEKPVELFRTYKVTWKRKAGWNDAQPQEFYADLIFTDVGLLVARHARLPRKGEGENAAWMQAGLVGWLIYAIAERRRLSRERTQAEKVYYRESEDWDDAKPATVFRRVTLSEFQPADEIADWTFDRRGVLTFRFRGQWCYATPDSRERTEEYHLPAEAEFERWRHEATETLAARAGGPEPAGPAAVAEWGQRPVGEVPGWVPDAVRTMEEHWGDRPKELIDWLPKAYLPGLFHRLGELDVPEAWAWHARLGRKLRVRGIVLLAVAVVVAVAGGTLGALIATGDDNPRNDEGFVAALIISGLIGLAALLIGGWGAAVLARYRTRPEIRA